MPDLRGPALLCALALALAAPAAGQEPSAAPLGLGAGSHRYLWDGGFFRLPEGMGFGNTHGGILEDAEGRLYVNTDTECAVLVFDRAGLFLRSFGKGLEGGVHGMTIALDEAGRQTLWLVHTGQGRVLRTTLEGEILEELPWPEASKKYAARSEFRPTSVAVAPDGSIWVADGYGKSLVHRYGKDRVWRSCIGGLGAEPGRFRVPHGLAIVRGRKTGPELFVADRENHRLQRFDLEGKHLGVIEGDLRRPCSVSERNGELVVADLAGRVTLLDGANRLIAHLGDQPDEGKRARNDVDRERWKDGEFVSPHFACWTASGDLLVMDWLRQGRVTRLARVPGR